MPAYLETEQELSRLARRAAGMRGGPRLLILPGIMGSSIGHLRKNGGADVTWFDPAEIAQGHLVKLALPAGSRYWALGVLKFAYERLRLVLRIAGFDAVFHPYDWRRDIDWNGHELADRLIRERRQDVVVVGHSMGGLVARAALAHKGGERISRVIQLGTPNKGVFVAVQALRGTYPLIRRVAMLDLKHSADELARELLVTLPGLCGLLPAASLCKNFDPFDPYEWPEGLRPSATLLAAAREAQPDLPAPDERFRLIAGFGQDTGYGDCHMTIFYSHELKDGVHIFTPVERQEPFWVGWPVGGTETPRITDKFNSPRGYANKKHEGLDCDGYINSSGELAPVLAAQTGVVEYVSKRMDNSSYGWHIVILHPWDGITDRYRTLYSHLSDISVEAGFTVLRGQQIGVAGRTGAISVHLHFGVYDSMAGLKGYVRCRDCTALFPEGVIDPESVLRYG